MSEEEKNKAKGTGQNPISAATVCPSDSVFNFLTQEYVDLRSLPDVEVACSSLNLNANEKRLAIRSIALRKKRQRGYDRILFQGPLNGEQSSSRGSNKSIAAEEELKKDRLDYITFLKRKYRSILPDELFDQSKQLQRQVGKILKMDDIIRMVEEKSQKRAVKKEAKIAQTKPTKDSKKKAANKQKEQADEEDDSKKKKKPKRKNQQEEGEEDNNIQGEDSLGEVSNPFVNNDDDDAGEGSAGGADDYDYD